MKHQLLLLLLITFATAALKAQTKGTFDSTKQVYTVKASCGKCKLGLTGKTCALAIKINGQTMYVDGATIDEFGDAHDDHGFCQAVRSARVQGEVVNGRFKLSYFELLPVKQKKR